MAKKIGLLMMLISSFLLPISVGATPSLGVIDTDLLATAGGTVPVGMDGFRFPSDGKITVWWGSDSGNWDTSMLNAHVWILTTQGNSSTFTVGPIVYELQVPVDGKIDGYPKPYFGADLGSIGDLGDPNGSWVQATSTTAPDLTGGSKSFFLLNGVFGGNLSTDNWIFAVADINSTNTTPSLLVFNNGDNGDKFSPKTTSTTVPEPSTLLLLGAGLVGLGIMGRKRFKRKN